MVQYNPDYNPNTKILYYTANSIKVVSNNSQRTIKVVSNNSQTYNMSVKRMMGTIIVLNNFNTILSSLQYVHNTIYLYTYAEVTDVLNVFS